MLAVVMGWKRDMFNISDLTITISIDLIYELKSEIFLIKLYKMKIDNKHEQHMLLLAFPINGKLVGRIIWI